MEYALIEIFTSEGAQHRGAPVYQAVLECVRRRRIAARVHVHRGIAGAYEGGEFAAVHLLDLSANLPVRVDILLPMAQAEGLLAELGDLVADGAVAIRPLDVRHHRTRHRLLPRDLRVQDVMTRDPAAVTPETPGSALLRLLMARNIRGVPVVDADGHVLGVVTEDDLIRRGGLPVRPGLLGRLGADPASAADAATNSAGAGLPLARLTAREMMTAPAVTVAMTATVEAAVAVMVKSQHRTLPVVDAGGRLVGMLSRLDILRVAAHWSRSLEQWQGSALELTGSLPVRAATTGADRRVGPGATLAEVLALMARGGVRRVAVTGADGRLLGVVAEQDVVQALVPRTGGGLLADLLRRLTHPGAPAGEPVAAAIMTANPVVAQADESLDQAVARLVEKGLKELPVVASDGQFLGFLSRREVLRAVANPC